MLHFPSSDIGMFGRRQRHARGHRIAVTIVSSAAAMPESRDTVIVVDAFGADDVVPLGGGCSCCAVRAELQNVLRRLLAERDHGRHFTRVVIETSNDLAPILRTFVAERALGAEFYVEDFPSPAKDTHRFVLTENTPLSWDTFSRFMTTLTSLRGADLLHVTGLLNIAGCRGPVVVQLMQHLAHRPVELQAWPNGDRASRITFVTRDIEEKTVRDLFNAVRALG